MTEINFYVSNEKGLEHRFAVVYRLIQRATQEKLHIHIHTDSELVNSQLDDYLWKQETTSFIPHAVIDSNSSEQDANSTDIKTNQQRPYQINISHEFTPLTDCDYLINISNQRPEFFSRFSKMAEILDNNEEIITAGRKRYSFYRDRGYTLGYYKL